MDKYSETERVLCNAEDARTPNICGIIRCMHLRKSREMEEREREKKNKQNDSDRDAESEAGR